MGVRTGQAAYRGRTAVRYTNEYYTEGNTVRVREAVADPRQAARARTQRELVKKHRRLNREAERTRTVSMNLPLTLMLIAAVAAVLFIGYSYLCLKSSIDIHSDNVKTLETTLEQMKNENDSLERSIDTSVDLNHVFDVAVNELGMVRAGQDNIIAYDKTESEYVRQYEDIAATDR